MKLPMKVVLRAQIALILLSGLGAGCAPAPQSKVDYYSQFRQSRVVLMRARWAGRFYADLVVAMGREGVSMTIPHSQGVDSSAVIFGVNDPLSGCIDSFVLNHGDEPIIDTYYCR